MRNIFYSVILGTLACSSEDGLKVYNSDPSISIQSHGMDAEIQEGLTTTFWAQASDGNHSFDELLCSWYAYDGAGNELSSCDWVAPDADGISSCAFTLSSDTTRISVNVKDPVDAGDADEITIQMISDEPPTIEILKPTVHRALERVSHAPGTKAERPQVRNPTNKKTTGVAQWMIALDAQ